MARATWGGGVSGKNLKDRMWAWGAAELRLHLSTLVAMGTQAGGPNANDESSFCLSSRQERMASRTKELRAEMERGECT